MSEPLTIEQVVLVANAATQYDKYGILDTTTYIALNNSGLDADNIETLIEETSNHGK